MKLLTHNILTSKMIKNVVTGYPLKIVATKVEVKEVDFQPDFIQRMMNGKMNYPALYEAAQSVSKIMKVKFAFKRLNLILILFSKLPKIGHAEGLPQVSDFNEQLLNDEEILKKLHNVLMEVEILEGDLVCPETGRKFPIQNGIPNMLLNEDEL